MWLVGTNYSVDAIVENAGRLWVCVEECTATADNEPGVGGDYAACWEQSWA
jgi:hypothetical protein